MIFYNFQNPYLVPINPEIRFCTLIMENACLKKSEKQGSNYSIQTPVGEKN